MKISLGGKGLRVPLATALKIEIRQDRKFVACSAKSVGATDLVLLAALVQWSLGTSPDWLQVRWQAGVRCASRAVGRVITENPGISGLTGRHTGAGNGSRPESDLLQQSRACNRATSAW